MTPFQALNRLFLLSVVAVSLNSDLLLAAAEAQSINIADRRQLFVDDFLISNLDGLCLKLHHPTPREIVMVRDKPWEGSGTQYERLIQDDGIIRMYYMGTELTNDDATKGGGWVDSYVAYACYAESKDGIHWTRPDLGLFECSGSKHNNIVWAGPAGLDNFTPFKDTNPDCPSSEKYKAVMSYGFGGLYAFVSPDGIHWSYLSDKPIITQGTFDSQNNAFWDPVRKQYWCYVRGFHSMYGNLAAPSATGIRDIRVATSKDFRTWSIPTLLKYPGMPDEALYTNQVEPYYRAPDLFLGFPTRYVDRKVWSQAAFRALPDPIHRQRRMGFNPRYGTAVTDGQFMTSRDGYTFHRWDETFITPGPQRSNNWVYGDGYQSLGLIETQAEDPTAPHELSLYLDEGHFKDAEPLRRYTIRIDGFVSIHAHQKAGEMVTKPILFSGKELTLNFSTSAGGTVLVELQGEDGRPIPGFTSGDCDELFGDTLERTVTWRDKSDVSALAGKPLRLHFILSDADLYSIRFRS